MRLLFWWTILLQYHYSYVSSCLLLIIEGSYGNIGKAYWSMVNSQTKCDSKDFYGKTRIETFYFTQIGVSAARWQHLLFVLLGLTTWRRGSSGSVLCRSGGGLVGLIPSYWNWFIKYLRILFMSEGRQEQETGRRIGALAVMQLLYWFTVVWALGSDWKNKIADITSRNELLLKAVWTHP